MARTGSGSGESQPADDGPVLEPEVLPPEGRLGRGGSEFRERLRLARYALLVDAINLVMRGPVAIRFGWLVGSVAAFAILTHLGWRRREPRIWIASALAGLYVMIPDPGMVPLAALAAVFAPLGGRAIPRGPV